MDLLIFRTAYLQAIAAERRSSTSVGAARRTGGALLSAYARRYDLQRVSLSRRRSWRWRWTFSLRLAAASAY